MLNVTAIFLSHSGNVSKSLDPATEQNLFTLLDKLGNPRLIHVENAADVDSRMTSYAGEYIYLPGDNSSWEFSGWQVGVEHLLTHFEDNDCIVFINDMFMKGDQQMVSELKPSMVEFSVFNNAIIGERVNLGIDGECFGHSMIPYIRTHLFVAPQSLFEILDGITSVTSSDIEQIFKSDYSDSTEMFSDSKEIPEGLKTFLGEYLKTTWQRHGSYEPSDLAFRDKAISLLNMLRLSQRIYELKFFPLVDVDQFDLCYEQNFLLTLLARLWREREDLGQVELAELVRARHL